MQPADLNAMNLFVQKESAPEESHEEGHSEAEQSAAEDSQ